ncbi:MAG: hypothetical protein GDA50_05220 [Alphaproteobacteria bacterium GM202ARS2]|nr:hypothetical protein [Alphaproteobacteria bacterium GM202ARS2]
MATIAQETQQLPSLNRPSVDPIPGLLSEIGMMAAGQGQQEQTESIFNAVMALRPNSDVPHIGRALSLMNSGDVQKSIRYLKEEALKQHPKSEGIMCVLALALALAGNKDESQKIVDTIRANGKEEWALAMAESLGKPS